MLKCVKVVFCDSMLNTLSLMAHECMACFAIFSLRSSSTGQKRDTSWLAEHETGRNNSKCVEIARCSPVVRSGKFPLYRFLSWINDSVACQKAFHGGEVKWEGKVLYELQHTKCNEVKSVWMHETQSLFIWKSCRMEALKIRLASVEVGPHSSAS